MKICVDPQGNFTKATMYHEVLTATEGANFVLCEVNDVDYNQAKALKSSGTTVRFIGGVFVSEEKSLEEVKQIKLSLILAATKEKIVGGFTSNASGSIMTYDSDEETQSTMQTMYAATKSPNFANHPDYQGVIPVRGYAVDSTLKTVVYLTADQVQTFMDDLALHIGKCKQEGWAKQNLVNNATTVTAVAEIVI